MAQYPSLSFDEEPTPVKAETPVMDLPPLSFDDEPALPPLSFDDDVMVVEEPTPPVVAEEQPVEPEKPKYSITPVMGTSAAEDDVLGVSAEGVAMQPMTPTEYGKFVGESALEVGKGAVSATAGLPGDVEALTTGVARAIQSPEGQSAWDAFSKGIQEETVLPTTEEVSVGLFGKPTEEQKTLRTAGEFLSLEGMIFKGASLARKVAQAENALSVSKKDANVFMDSYQEFINTQTVSGADNVQAYQAANEYFNVDDAFVQQMTDKTKRKVKFMTPENAQEALKATEVVADPSAVSVIADVFDRFTGRRISNSLKAVDRGLGVISTRVKNISKPVYNRLRDMDRKQYQGMHKAAIETAPFLDDINKLADDVRPTFDRALANGDFEVVRDILETTGGPESVANFDRVRTLLDTVQQDAQKAGINVGYLEDYFPRVITDLEGFRKAAGLADNKEIDKLLVDAANKKGDQLTEAEATDVINKYLRGYPKGLGEGKPSNVLERKLEVIDPELMQYYANPATALQTYLHRMINNIEQRNFLGQAIDIDPDTGIANYKNSVGNFVLKEKEAGKITAAQEAELKSILEARLAPGHISEGVQELKNYMYMGTLVDPIATITQFGDVAMSLYHSGVKPTVEAVVKNATGNSAVKLDDFGFKEMTEDLADVTKSRKWLDTMFKGTLFSSVDRFGKETILNSALAKHTKQVKNPIELAKFKKEWGETFGDDFNQLVKDLKEGNTESEHVQLLLWHRLADAQPISLSEMPQKYLEMKGGKLLYMLKTFTLKQFDIVRRDALQKLKKPETMKEGIQNLIRYTTVFTAAGMTTDEIKAQLLGRDTDLSTLVEENLLKIVGLNRYSLEQIDKEGFWESGLRTIAPPGSVLTNWSSGLYDAIVNQELSSKFVKSLPLGDLIESRLMGGAEKYNERKMQRDINEMLGPTETGVEGFAKGGLISQLRKRYALGGMAATDDPEGVSTEGVDMPEDRPLSEDIRRAGKTYEHMARGATAATIGGAGDIESLGRGIYEGATGEGSFGEGFMRGMQEETVLPTTEDVKKYLPEVTGDEFMTDKQREVASGMGEFTGLTLPIGAAAKGTAIAAKAGSKRVKDYVDEIYNNPGQVAYAKNTDRELENAFERDQFKREMEEYDALTDANNPSTKPQSEKPWKSQADNPRTQREAEKILRAIESGKADINDAAEFAFDQQRKASTANLWRQTKGDRDRVRGYRAYASRVNDFVDKGYISDESADIALWFVDKNRKLVDDMSITAVSDLGKDTGGVYSLSERLVKLSKGEQIPELVIHETLHHTERMLPSDIRNGIRDAWMAAVKKEIKVAKKAGQTGRAEALADVMMLPYVKGADLNALTQRMKQYAKDKVLKSGDYQFTNPSEFWAVNGSNILRNQYKVQGKWVGKAVEYYKQLAEKVKDVFGLANTNALYKGLKNLETSSGNFLRKEGLREVQDISNFIERNNIYGWSQEGLATRFQMSDILDIAKEGEKDFLDSLPSKTLPDVDNIGKDAYDVLGKSLEDKKAWQSANKINQKQEQTPELLDQAKQLFEGKITGDEFRASAADLRPPTVFTEVTKMPTFEEIIFSLDENKVAKGIVGLNKEIPDGTEVASRLDIPAYERYDTWVVSLHESGGRSTRGDAIGYGKTAVLNNVEFGTQPRAAIGIAMGKNKTTIGRVYGQWENHDSEEIYQVAQKLLNDPAWTQVGMNPYRASYFYDKETMEPVVAADQVVQVGPLVLAKDAQKTSPNDPRFKFLKDGEQTFADGGVADGNLNEGMRPEMDMPVEQPQQEVVVQAEQPKKPSIKMPPKQQKKDHVEEYLDNLAIVESSGNTNAYAETSGALGLYQFVPKTWESMVNRYMPELKQQKGDYMEFRRNPEVSRYMARKLMEENQNILKKNKFNATKGNLYLAHFAGPSAALNVLRAKPNTRVEDVLSPGQIKRNPGVFSKVKTTDQLIKWAQSKILLEKFKKKR